MPSSRCSLLDYASQLAENISHNPLLVEVEDEFVASVLRRQMREALGEVRFFFGQELTVPIFEEKLLGLDLFSRNEPLLIWDAHQMPKESVNFLLAADVDWGQKRAIFVAGKKSKILSDFFAQQGHRQRVELPRFWQMEQLLDFFAKHFELSFDREGKRFFVDSVEQSSRRYFELCSRLRGEYPTLKVLGRREVAEVLSGGARLDKFALARHLGEGNLLALFGALAGEEHSFEDLRQIFSFLQSHVVKLLDPSYLEGKGKLSSYDRQILAQSGKWRGEASGEMLRKLGEWELACKKRDSGLKNRLRMASLA